MTAVDPAIRPGDYLKPGEEYTNGLKKRMNEWLEPTGQTIQSSMIGTPNADLGQTRRTKSIYQRSRAQWRL